MDEILYSDYSEEWLELLSLECIGFVHGQFGPYTCAFQHDTCYYKKCLEYITSHETAQVIPDTPVRQSLLEIGAIEYS